MPAYASGAESDPTRPRDDATYAHGSSLLSDISNAMVRAMKRYWGKGPTRAKSYMVDDYLFIAMKGGFTVVEETLLRSGKHHLVREVRQTFQNEMTAEFTRMIEELTGRRVLGYQSQIMFDPDTVFEIFVLDSAGDGSDEAEATASDQQSPEGAPVGEAEPAVVGEARNTDDE